MNVYVGGSESITSIPEVAAERIGALAGEGAGFIFGAKTKVDDLLNELITGTYDVPVNIYVFDESLPEKSDYDDEDEDESEAVKSSGTSVDKPTIVKVPPREGYRRRIFNKDMYRFSADDRAMLKVAERGLFIWEANDERIFMNILELAYYKKPVTVIADGKLIEIENPVDLKKLVPEPDEMYTKAWDILPSVFFQKAVTEAVPSEYMREFLLSYSSAPKHIVLDVILYSPISVAKKLELLKEFVVTDDERNELINKVCTEKRSMWCEGVEGYSCDIFRDLFKTQIISHSEALDSLNVSDGGFFVLKRIDFSYPDEKAGEFYEKIKKPKDLPWMRGEDFHKCERLGEFPDYEKTLTFLRDYIHKENITIDSLCWFKLEKWEPNPKYSSENGEDEFDNPYTYYMIMDEPVYFSKNSQTIYGNWAEYPEYFEGGRLDLPAPYNVGEIVKIDLRPFAPDTYALMLSDGKEETTLHTAGHGLFHTHDNKWKVHFFHCYHPFMGCHGSVSSYYGLSKFEGELPEEYSIFKDLQEKIKGDPGIADKLRRHIFYLEKDEFSDGITDEEFEGLLASDWVNGAAPTDEELKAVRKKAEEERNKAGGFTIEVELDLGRE